jgi:multicomponent K+:H+ antiporter subunit E
MSRILPYPLLWVALLAMWLLLSDSLAPGQWLLGAVVATLASLAMRRLQPPRSKIRNLGAILGLCGAFAVDVARSNIAVIGLVFSRRRPRPAMVTIPLELTDPNGLAILSFIITATPGSAWVDYRSRPGSVTVHVLDVADKEEWGRTIKHQYEARLLEIFQ